MPNINSAKNWTCVWMGTGALKWMGNGKKMEKNRKDAMWKLWGVDLDQHTVHVYLVWN